MKTKKVACLFVCSMLWALAPPASTRAQTVLASVTGLVLDPNAAAVVEATVTAKNVDTGIETIVHTNSEGLYHFANLEPGNYEFSVSKRGFKVIVKPGVTLHVVDTLSMNFTMQVGDVRETVTVEGGAPLIDTQSAAVGTVVDRQFAENLPMNGRSFQTLIQITPGVVLTVSNTSDGGQFSVNGQRASSNYWMVDGVSANTGIGLSNTLGNGAGGALPSFSVLGGTNSLVSVDALQEFRIQTSTYAPEFGRTPGGQISILTRSGTNQFHGSVFDYLRNDVLDANDWFADRDKLPKPEERQNDFGGTFSGRILKDRTFFFFSYEGLRLRLPGTALTTVPDLSARQNAIPAVQPILNAYPFDPKQPDLGNGVAQFDASFSNPATLDAYSIRVDHRLSDKLNLFGRYNYSPSDTTQRGGGGGGSLSMLVSSSVTAQTATAGATWMISSVTANDLRFNYSRTHADGGSSLDNFHGATPLTSLALPSPYSIQNSFFVFQTLDLSSLQAGGTSPNVQRQINVVDNLSAQRGSHSLKFGADFRRLSPIYDPLPYSQQPLFLDTPSAENGNLLFASVLAFKGSTLSFRNLGLFVQDTWRLLPNLTLTYGLRWDIDFTPTSLDGPSLLAVTGYNVNDTSQLALAPAGTPVFKTTYGNVAPRIGLAYQPSKKQEWATVLRGGFGLFYDLATSEVGNNFNISYPYAALKTISGPLLGGTGTFPLSSTDAAPPPITPAGLALPGGILYAFDPNLTLPYTLQWNVALEQALAAQQTVRASYIGSVGRRLIQSVLINTPNPSFTEADLIGNTAASNYHALQVQFQRRLSHGLQTLASYTWSHSIDDASAGSASGNPANTAAPGFNPNINRGPSDFDIRHAFSAGTTYDIPMRRANGVTNAILRGWSLQNVIQARSASPVNVYEPAISSLKQGITQVRPDLTGGIPLYLFGPQYPGGRAINATPGAVVGGCPDGSTSVGPFCPPPTNGSSARQGTLGRNALRGFGATQWDFAVHRVFPIHESFKLQFRAEMFNVLNHPNFGNPVSGIGLQHFGQSTQMLGQSLNFQNLGGGGFSPLYQVGGPRSIQVALKLLF